MENKKPLVVVLSRNYSTGLSVIRSLGAAGYTIDLVASAHKAGVSEIAAKSKYVRNYVEVVSKKVKDGDDNELLDALLQYAGKSEEKIVLFPADDYTTAIMDLNRSTLEPYFIMPTIVGGEDGVLTRHMDKTVQGEMARAAGLLTPKEWIISLEEGVIIPEDMIYPCFCKPIESITGYKKEMAKCEDEEELEKHLKKLRKKFANRSVLVQEFLEIDNEIDLSGVCLDQEIIIPAIIKKTNVAQYEKGVTLAGKVVPFEELGEVQKPVIKMLKLFRYVGMFDMELNIVGDKIYFNEVNLRSGGPNYSYYMSGVNLPALFVKEALGEKHTVEEEQVEVYGKSFIYEKVAWQDYINGFITKKELNACISAADIKLLCNDDDPEPGKLFLKKIKQTASRKKIGNAKKRVRKSVKKVFRSIKRFIRPIIQYAKGYPQTRKKNQRDPNAERPRVLVSGRNYCSNLCMARSLGQAGYEVEILRIFQVKPKKRDLLKRLEPDAFSKYVKAYHVCISKRKSKRIVKRLIRLADPNHKMLLIPADDLIASIADKYLDKLSEHYYLPNVNMEEGEINRLMSKEVQKELAIAAGLPVIKSCVIKTVNGEFEIPDSVTYPCFMKPNISRNSSKGRMRKCNSEAELRGYLTEFSQKKDIEMLVEDFVEIKREYSLLGVSTKDGAVGPGLFVAEEGGQEEHRGVALVGRILDCSEMQPLVDDLIRFVGSLGFDGLYDVDLIETVDGKIYFVEINMRFGASGYAVTESGVNLPGMFADYMLFNKPIDFDCKINQAGKKFVSEKILIDEYAKGRIEKAKISSSMNEVDVHFIKNAEDMRPYKHFKKFYPIASMLRTIYKKKISKGIKRFFRRIKAFLRPFVQYAKGYPQSRKKNQRDPNAERPRVMVSGRNYCSNLCMARSLGQAGYEVEILRIFQVKPKKKDLMKRLKPDAFSKYVKAYYVCVSNRRNKRIVKRLIRLADPDRKMLLIPADDLVASIADKYLDELSEYYYLPNVNMEAGEINRLMSKEVQKELAVAAGLPVIKSCVIKTVKGEFEIPDTVTYPCFIKPNISRNSSKGRMRKCNSEAELHEHLRRFSRKKDIEMLVEDFVEIKREYSLLGISTKNGAVGPGLFVAEEGGQAEHRGVALVGRILNCSEMQPLVDDVVKFVGSLGFDGLYDVDLIETIEGKIYFVEVNMRFGASGYAVTESGVNLPGMFADYMLFNKPIDFDCRIDQAGKKFVSEKILIDEYAKGRIEKAKIGDSMKAVDVHFVKDDADMRPYKHFKKFYPIASLLRPIYIKKELEKQEKEQRRLQNLN